MADPHAAPVVETPAEQDLAPRDLAAFYSLGRELAVPGGVSDIGEAIWATLRTELGAASCVLFVYDEGRDALAPAFRGGVETLPPDARVSRSAIGSADGWRRPVTPIVNSDARLDVDPGLRDHSPLQSALAVPIGDGEQLGGVLAFYSDRQARLHASASAHGGSRGRARRDARVRGARRVHGRASGRDSKQHARVPRLNTPATRTRSITRSHTARDCARPRVAPRHT